MATKEQIAELTNEQLSNLTVGEMLEIINKFSIASLNETFFEYLYNRKEDFTNLEWETFLQKIVKEGDDVITFANKIPKGILKDITEICDNVFL